MAKSAHIQIRVSPTQKAALRRFAKKSGLGMSEFVLGRIFSETKKAWMDLLGKLARSHDPSYVLAEIHDFLVNLSHSDWNTVLSEAPDVELDPVWINYVCAMIEVTASQKTRLTPAWTYNVMPSDKPYFATEMTSLRLHLLTSSPPPFRRRRIFIDSSIGARV